MHSGRRRRQEISHKEPTQQTLRCRVRTLSSFVLSTSATRSWKRLPKLSAMPANSSTLLITSWNILTTAARPLHPLSGIPCLWLHAKIIAYAPTCHTFLQRAAGRRSYGNVKSAAIRRSLALQMRRVLATCSTRTFQTLLALEKYRRTRCV